MTVASAPWSLSGECLLAVCLSGGSPGGRLPHGIVGMPGPVVVVAARYDTSPVGPYQEMVVLEPARAGARIGMCATTAAVDSAEARLGGRVNWGIPKELGTLVWSDEGDRRTLRWVERGIAVTGTPHGPALPALVPFRSVQRRADGVVSIRSRSRGAARLATVEVEVEPGDDLCRLAGRHRGAIVSSLRVVMAPARLHERSPAARSSREAAEPALSSGSRGD